MAMYGYIGLYRLMHGYVGSCMALLGLSKVVYACVWLCRQCKLWLCRNM